MSDFFRLVEKERFRFYRLPKALFLDEEYSDLSSNAKLLYGLLYDRMELSCLNKWTDECGRVFIHFTIREAANLLGFGREKTSGLFAELESHDLILRRRQGRGRADIIYPKKVHSGKTDLFVSENQPSGSAETGFQEVGKSGINDTEIKDTESTETHLSSDEMERRIRAQIEYVILCGREPADRIDELVSIIGQVLRVRSATMTIGGCEYDTEYVQSRFRKLGAHHIEYVLYCMDAGASKIRNMSAYLITALFNAPATIGNYYQSEVNHDMAAWCNA